jgi:predicted Zn-dependent peptidase
LNKKLSNSTSTFHKPGFFSIHNQRDNEENRSKDKDKYWVTEHDKSYRIKSKVEGLQFSKAPIMDNFGELQPGEIPEPLKFTRDFKMTTLNNGIRVCTEVWDCPTIAVGVFIDAGSRYETQETSGTAHFLEHLLFKGTKNRTKSQFEFEIENMGATLDAYTSREHTLFHMTAFKQNSRNCVDILSDIIQNPLLGNDMIAEEKDTIKTELEESNKDTQETIMEAVHFNCFRDHMMGGPILGDIDNIYNVNKNMVEEYYSTNYIGKNLIVVGTGGLNHDEFVRSVEEKFGKLK